MYLSAYYSTFTEKASSMLSPFQWSSTTMIFQLMTLDLYPSFLQRLQLSLHSKVMGFWLFIKGSLSLLYAIHFPSI